MTAAATLLVPAWNAETFLAETLDSIAAQHFGRFRVLVSLDASSDGSETICRRYLGDLRFSLIMQPRRLGWVGNINHLLGMVESEYFCIAPHDDILDPRFLSKLVPLAADQATACAYSDLQGFGTAKPALRQSEIRGDLCERVLEFLLHHYMAIPFRGVVRRRGPHDRPLLPTGLLLDFGADLLWLLRIVLRGDFRRHPAVLVHKRYAAGSAHTSWYDLPRATQVTALAEHAAMAALFQRHLGNACGVLPAAGLPSGPAAAPLVAALAVGKACGALGNRPPEPALEALQAALRIHPANIGLHWQAAHALALRAEIETDPALVARLLGRARALAPDVLPAHL